MGGRNVNSIKAALNRIEAYGREEALVEAVEAENWKKAAALCREAMNDAAYRARYNCAPIGPEGHKRNFDALRELRALIRSHGPEE